MIHPYNDNSPIAESRFIYVPRETYKDIIDSRPPLPEIDIISRSERWRPLNNSTLKPSPTSESKLVDVDLVTDVNYYRPQNIFIRFICWILRIPLD